MLYVKTEQGTVELLVPDYSDKIEQLSKDVSGLVAKTNRLEMYLNPLMYYEKDADEIVGTWINGKAIHRRVLTKRFTEPMFTDSGNGGKTAVWELPTNYNISKIYKMDVMSDSLPGFVGQYCDPSNGGNWGVAGDYFRVFFHRTEKNLYVTCGNANPPRPFSVTVIMYFDKY